MAGLTISQFEQTIFSICGNSKIIQSVAQIQSGFDWVAIRAYISETLFLDVFYNERNGKTSTRLSKIINEFSARTTQKGMALASFTSPP